MGRGPIRQYSTGRRVAQRGGLGYSQEGGGRRREGRDCSGYGGKVSAGIWETAMCLPCVGGGGGRGLSRDLVAIEKRIIIKLRAVC